MLSAAEIAILLRAGPSSATPDALAPNENTSGYKNPLAVRYRLDQVLTRSEK